MAKTIRLAPPNSILFIADREGGITPQITREGNVWSTPSCVAFGCLMEQDGPTEITLGPVEDVSLQHAPTFDDLLNTPTRIVIVSTSERTSVLEIAVRDTRTRLRIWTNRRSEPDKVVIGVG
jgi:hypothetical protein